MTLTLVSAGATFLSTMGGGIAALRWPRQLEGLMAFAGGLVLAAALLDLLPEAVERAGQLHISLRVPLAATLAGYLVFHAAERLARPADEDRESPGRAATWGAAGFVVHSFFDGLAIGLGFQVDSAVGLLVALAVIGHDMADGLSTVSYLTAHGASSRRSRRWLLVDALAPLTGALVASVADVPEAVFPLALGFFSGLFIHAAATTLLARADGLRPARSVPLTLLGAALVLGISRLA